MTRYTRVFASIWDDDDFRALTASAQRIYLLIITQPNISHCGVATLSERRWSRLAPDTDADSVRAAIDELQRAKFVVVDEDTEEVLARAYMKWAEFYRVPNGKKACSKAIEQVLSKPLRTLCETLLETLTGTVAPPQQQAAKSQQPLTTSQQPAAALTSVNNCPPLDHEKAAAADYEQAIALALEHRRIHTANINNPGRWAEVTRQGIEADYGRRMVKLLADGMTPVEVVDAIYSRQRQQPAVDQEAAHARSAARGHLLTGATPADAYTEAIASYPRQHDAICAELDWTPEEQTA